MNLLKIFILGVLVGGSLELLVLFSSFKLFGKKIKTHHRFTFGGYLSLVSVLLWGIVAEIYVFGPAALHFFVYSALLGSTGEFIVGYIWHETFGHRLWTYSRLSINGYTSLLSFPFWGIGGILFLFSLSLLASQFSLSS